MSALDTDPAVGEEKVDGEVAKFKHAARRCEEIPIILIHRSEAALRDVQRNNETFQYLFDSIKKRGVLNSILVREVIDPATQVKSYGLIDGLQRLTCATEAGQTTIPANIVEMSDAEVLEAQIITNLNKIATRPVELSKHLLRLLQHNPFMTKRELAERVSQSLTWVEERLSLDNLDPAIKPLVDEGLIKLTNAYALSKIPLEEQAQHVDAAQTEDHKTFVPKITKRCKEIRDAKKAGRDATDANAFVPVLYMQKVGDVKADYEGGLEKVKTVLAQNGLTKQEHYEAAQLVIAWILHADAGSIQQQKEAHEARLKKREVEAAARKEEKELEDAAKKQADILSL
jgi:ParB/RepB/Spo0J family partition protein